MKTAAVFVLFALGASRLPGAAMDGEEVYRSNCTRCHIAIRVYPQKMTRSIVRHMRVRALLTKPEADAVLAYLAASYEPPAKKARRAAQ